MRPVSANDFSGPRQNRIVDLIGLRQHAGNWEIAIQTCPFLGFDWELIRAERRDVTGPSLYKDEACVFERSDLLSLATRPEARAGIDGPAAAAEIFLIVLAENVESGLGD